MIIAMPFEDSWAWFQLSLFLQTLAGRPWTLQQASTTLYRFRNLVIKAKSAEATPALACAKKIMKCSASRLASGLCSSVPRSHRDFSGSLVSVSQSALVIQCCGFILSRENCHLIGKRMQTVCNTGKNTVKTTQGWESGLIGWSPSAVLTQPNQDTSLQLSFPKRKGV